MNTETIFEPGSASLIKLGDWSPSTDRRKFIPRHVGRRSLCILQAESEELESDCAKKPTKDIAIVPREDNTNDTNGGISQMNSNELMEESLSLADKAERYLQAALQDLNKAVPEQPTSQSVVTETRLSDKSPVAGVQSERRQRLEQLFLAKTVALKDEAAYLEQAIALASEQLYDRTWDSQNATIDLSE